MKLRHKDKKIAATEGVIERFGLDAREILATGNYEHASDEPEKVEAEVEVETVPAKKKK
jgi:hypothetical protein